MSTPTEEALLLCCLGRNVTGQAITKIAGELNDEGVPTKTRLKGGWNVSTISRILKDEKYTGKYVWNRSTHVKDPLSGKRKKVEHAKEEWVTQDRPEMRIISDEIWAAAQKRWSQIDRAFPIRRAKRAPQAPQRSYVEANPTHLLSGALKCGSCGGAMALVSGKGSGYYGCLNGSRKSCDNRVLIARKRLEEQLVGALNEEVLNADVLELVYERTAAKVREHFKHVPEELRLKKLELSRAESRVHHFIEFIASGRATPALADALAQAEEQVKTLTGDVAAMEGAKDHAFTPPPRAWIADRLKKLNDLLGSRTDKAALALRDLTGPVTLTPQVPEVGKPSATCRFNALNLLAIADGGVGSNRLHWWS